MSLKLQSWQLWSRTIYMVGIFFFALSLGWAWGLKAARPEPLVVATVFGIGLLGLFGGALLQSRVQSTIRKFSEESVRARPVDLDESFRAYRTYFDQPPLFESDILQTQIFAISSKKVIKVPKGYHLMVIEVWEGMEVALNVNAKTYSIPARSVLQITLNSPTFELEPNMAVDQTHCQGIVHFISLDGAVES